MMVNGARNVDKDLMLDCGCARVCSLERDFLARRESTMPRDDVASPAKQDAMLGIDEKRRADIDRRSFEPHRSSGGGDYSRIEDDS